MRDTDTSPAALRALAEQMDDVSLIPAKIGDVACDTLRALAAEKEAATVKDGLTVGAEVKPLKAVAVMGVRPPPAQEPSSTVHAPADLCTLAEAATPGPWQVDITRHPYSMVRLDGSFAEGEHVERWIQTVRIDPQAKAPHPIVVRSVGIAHPGEPAITMVHIRPEDADYLAAVSPEVVLALLDTIDALRASLAAAEKERDEADAGFEAIEAKFATLCRVGRDCGCSYDAKDHVCMYHSPQLVAAVKRAEKAEAERDAARWQPIETAPRDGTLIDLWAGERIANCAWNVPSKCWAERVGAGFGGKHWAVVNNPTHWMPLPAASGQPKDPAHD